MARFLAVSTCALGIALGSAAPAAADRGEPATQAVSVDSLKDFDKCQKQHERAGSEACLDALKDYVKTHPKDAFDAGKRARLHYMHWVALDFFAQALSAEPSKKRCADEDLSTAVIAGLSLPPRYPAVALAQKLVSESCREPLETTVIAQLDRAGGYFRSNACPLVADKVRGAQCAQVAEPPVAAAPAPAPEPTAADQVAKAVKLREAPPPRKETPQATRTHRLSQVFPLIGTAEFTPGPHNTAGEQKPLSLDVAQLDSESAEVLRGTHGEELMMARTRLGGNQYVLLKFKGVRGPWNERVLVARERSGDAGKDYVVMLEDHEMVVMIERQRQYQAFPKGIKGGLWLNPVRPGEPDFKLPTRREIASEFATVAKPEN